MDKREEFIQHLVDRGHDRGEVERAVDQLFEFAQAIANAARRIWEQLKEFLTTIAESINQKHEEAKLRRDRQMARTRHQQFMKVKVGMPELGIGKIPNLCPQIQMQAPRVSLPRRGI